MSPIEFDPDDEQVAEVAVAALNAAHRRAVDSGRPMVVLIGDELVRITAAGRTVLKKLPPRLKVAVRTKRASS